MELPQILPSVDCVTRWGSTYMMICDILSTRPAFERLAESQNMDVLDDDEIRTLKSLRCFLEPYYTLTKTVCSSTAPCSLMLAGGKLLLAKTEKTLSETRSRVKPFGEMLLAKTTKYFANCFLDETVRMATLLDPRFAFVETILNADDWWKISQRLVDKKLSTAESECDDEDAISSQKSRGVESCFWDPLFAEPTEPECKKGNFSTKEDEILIELRQYSLLLKKSRPENNANPYRWWHLHSEQFPFLAKEVPKYLVIPATSVDCERLFSLAGIVYGHKRRGRLSGKNARLLLMIKANEDKDVGRECKAWTRSELKRYSHYDDEKEDSEALEDEEMSSTSEEDFFEDDGKTVDSNSNYDDNELL